MSRRRGGRAKRGAPSAHTTGSVITQWPIGQQCELGCSSGGGVGATHDDPNLRSLSARYHDATKALEADRATLRDEIERVLAAERAREAETAAMRANLEARLAANADASKSGSNDGDDEVARALRDELARAKTALKLAEVDAEVRLGDARDERERVETSALEARVEMERALGEMRCAPCERFSPTARFQRLIASPFN